MAQVATTSLGGRGIHGMQGPSIERGVDRATIAGQDAGRIGIDLLGGLRVRVGKTTMGPREFGGAKPRTRPAGPAPAPGFPGVQGPARVTAVGGSPPSCAKATLEAYVCVLRKKLQPCQAVRASLITTVAGCYAIDMSRVDLDVVRYERLMSAALQPATSAADALPMLHEAMALAESPLLPEEVDSEWLDEMRTNPQPERPQGHDRRGPQGRRTAVR